MTREEIENGNKLIADFMQLEKYNRSEWLHNGEIVSELKYNQSWDWLMPVVEKLERLEGFGYSFQICKGHISMQNTFNGIPVNGSKLESLYELVVSCIKGYNQNKQSNGL